MKNEFENLMVSEKKKVLAYAKKAFHEMCTITGITYNKKPDCLGFVEVACEICNANMDRRVGTVVVQVFMPDRRRTWCSKAVDYR